ncbi:Lambda phage tail tape-measure protein (Tape meas lam C) [Pseudomonas fluorescens]|uniref:tape measure protein n=1 Tax=Pseudomonas fluorescens TaxID=294 RepID=UPI000762DA2A|nr:tape measure protein [Pseudomonas fluorescens]KWV81453.1 Lambda phage tail tape-measure protein (Tape meas lam C) [Pseudomonas fluorescens]
MADTDVQGMLVRIEATTAQLRQEMARADSTVGQSAGKIDKSLGRIDTAFDRAGESAQSAAGLIKNALAVAVGAASVGKIIETADSFSQMSDRIGMATGSVNEYNLVQDRLLDTAKRTYRPLAEAQELYIRTADSLKSMGYNTSQALDVMDSFSFLLVTNSASAEKASSAIDAYSKALQTGKVEADGWQSILAAMPTVVETIAKSTGKTVEEIRSLGAQGKLSLDILTEGLQKSAEANGLLADSMGVAVRDAMQNLNNAFSVYVGRLNETTDGTGVLAKGIGTLGDNFGTLADIAGVVAVGALAGYGRQLAGSAAASVSATRAAVADALARKAQVTAVLLAAQAEQQKAQTSVFLAQKEAIAARGTAVQTQMSLQLAEARMVETRATNAVAAAQAAASRASLGVMGVLGGPAGIAVLAIGAATAFLTLRDNTSVLEKKLGDLGDPIDKLVDRFNKLNRATQSVTLRELKASIEDAESDLTTAAGSIAFEFQSSLTNAGLAGASGFMGGIAPLPAEFQSAMDVIKKASSDQSAGMVVDWKAVADQVREVPGVTAEMVDALEKSGGAAAEKAELIAQLKNALAELTGETDANTRAERENAAARAGANEAGQKYLDQLLKQLASAQDKTSLEAANRYIAENTLLTEDMVVAIRSAAAAKDAQKASDDAAAKASRKNTTEGQSAAKQQLKSFDTAEEGYKRQIELINTTGDKQKDATEVMKLSFELQEGKLGKLSEAQKKKLMGMAAELDALNKLKKANEDDLKLTAFRNAQGVGTQTMKDGFDQELKGVGMGDKARDRMRADLALQQKYAADVASLNEQLQAKSIDKSLYDQETTVLQEALAERIIAQELYYQAIDEQQSNWMNGVNEAWANYADAARDYSAQAADFTNTALSEATSGLGTLFSDVASGAEDADDALGDMVGNFAKSMLKALGDMAAQWLIYQGVQLLVGKATQAGAATALGANAAAMSLQAGLNAYASTAAIPIIGPAAAPAAMATALTVTGPLAQAVGMTALSGMAHDGIDSVPEDGSWFLQKGERVTTAQTSAKLDAMLSRIDNSLSGAQPEARIGVGSLESTGNGRAALVGASPATTPSGPTQIVFNAPINVQAQPGMSDQEAARQGQAMSSGLEAQFGKFLDREMGQGGRLWRR